jgi:carboxyl-terminal processing protease
VRGIIRSAALKPSSDDSITANGVSGMLKSLDDPYAMYFDPKAYGFFKDDTAGQFFGIGVTISVDATGHAMVGAVLKGTPAQRAKLKTGDEILKIDGFHKAGWTSEDVVSRVRGPEGTKVVLLIHRKGIADLSVTLTRAKIETPNDMAEMIGGDVGYIRLFTFNAKAGDEVGKAITDLGKKGAKGYILDLRDDPGGLLQSGVDVASLFVKSGPIVRVDQRNMPEEVSDATGHVVTDKPLVVLVNQNSASASEIVAGALQDYKRATLVGVKSFGKGSVQTVKQLSNGGAVKLTIAHYLTPNRHLIDHKGLMPDVLVPMELKDQASKKTDKQLTEAVVVLRGMFK